MRSALAAAALGGAALFLGVVGGRYIQPNADSKARLKSVIWAQFELEARAGALQEWRFPVMNELDRPMELPALRLDGCSQCIDAYWALPAEFGDGSPTLPPGTRVSERRDGNWR